MFYELTTFVTLMKARDHLQALREFEEKAFDGLPVV